ncbi:MAG: LysR family transcriptional regulator [Eubacteriaceae bacterium]|nr:LysR family transcriptional regulator [Eubacteriaceae bacterium]
MHINQLKYFVSVAYYQSFTQAAEYHHMKQAAITQQIKALEDRMNVVLFNRHKRPIELTPAGRVLYHEARAILERVEGAVAKTREASTGAVGSIRIGYEKGYERSDLSDRLRDFHNEYPNILLVCHREGTDALADRLMSDDLDVIFAWDSKNISTRDEINHKLDMRSGLSVVLYTGHPFATRRYLKREELCNETILYMTPSGNDDSIGDMHYMQLYEKAGFQPKILLKSNDLESLLMMVAAEQGVTVVPSYCVEKLNNADNLVFLPLDGEEEYEDIYMMWKSSHSNAALQCFFEFYK